MAQIIVVLLFLAGDLSAASFIGNTGLPATTTGHVPFFIAGLAADHQGRVYTVHIWDEPHQDVICWDAGTGAKLFHTGWLVPEAFLNSIAVEPDGSIAYVTGWTQESPAQVFRLYKIQISPPAVINFSSAGRSVELATGQPVSSTEKFLVQVNPHSVAVANPNTGQITYYDKNTGITQRTTNGSLPDDTKVKTGCHTVSREYIANGAGSRLIGQGWEQRCSEFVGCISYSQANPDIFISATRNLYSRSGAWVGCGITDTQKEPPPATGPCKTITLGGTDFLYYPYGGNYLSVYRVTQGAMSVVSTVTPAGLVLNSFGVSPDGTLWLSVVVTYATGEYCSIQKLPLHGLDASGNPLYEWADVTEVVTQSTLLNAFNQTDPRSVSVTMAAYSATDSIIYALLYVPGAGPDRGSYWMAGNVLAALSPQGALQWKTVLPAPGIGLAVIPTGGVFIGQNAPENGVILRYNASGGLAGTISPPPGDNWPTGLPSGAFDCFGAINAELAPDGLLDIFAEDDFNQRIIWYRLP